MSDNLIEDVVADIAADIAVRMSAGFFLTGIDLPRAIAVTAGVLAGLELAFTNPEHAQAIRLAAKGGNRIDIGAGLVDVLRGLAIRVVDDSEEVD